MYKGQMLIDTDCWCYSFKNLIEELWIPEMRYYNVFGAMVSCYTSWRNSPAAALGAQWLSGRVLDSRPKGRGFEPHRRHCAVSLSKTQ